ncbi:DUF6807 family protein [Flagellimonas sp. 2504JD4-2]
MEYYWESDDESCALVSRKDGIIWKLNFDLEHGKPFFYPLSNSYGTNMVWCRPNDHPWHYGHWFSWKYLNGVNFWEENQDTRESEGIIKIVDVKKELLAGYGANFIFQIEYCLKNGGAILEEKRAIKISELDSLGSYFIDWKLNFRGQSVDVIFDRTIPGNLGGPGWGGYAGLSIRFAKELMGHSFMMSNGDILMDDVVGYGKKGKWMDMTGQFKESQVTAGISIFNHPDNNETVPWYIYKHKAFAFYNPALIFEKSFQINRGDEFELNYRVFIHNDRLSFAEIEKKYEDYVN